MTTKLETVDWHQGRLAESSITVDVGLPKIYLILWRNASLSVLRTQTEKVRHFISFLLQNHVRTFFDNTKCLSEPGMMGTCSGEKSSRWTYDVSTVKIDSLMIYISRQMTMYVKSSNGVDATQGADVTVDHPIVSRPRKAVKSVAREIRSTGRNRSHG